MTRTFIAVELPPEVKAAMQARVADLARGMPTVRFVAPETWHLTLAFLSELDDTQLAAARTAAREAVVGSIPFTLQIGDLGFFGPRDAPRVIWIGVSGDLDALQGVQRHLMTTLQAHDLHCADRFAPHITLARLKQPLAPAAAQHFTLLQAPQPPGPTWLVAGISIMRSDLSPQGAHYTRLEFMALHPTP